MPVNGATDALAERLNARIRVNGNAEIYEEMRRQGWDAERVLREMEGMITRAIARDRAQGNTEENLPSAPLLVEDQQNLLRQLNFLRYIAEENRQRTKAGNDQSALKSFARYVEVVGKVQEMLRQRNARLINFAIGELNKRINMQYYYRRYGEQAIQSAAEYYLGLCVAYYDPDNSKRARFDSYTVSSLKYLHNNLKRYLGEPRRLTADPTLIQEGAEDPELARVDENEYFEKLMLEAGLDEREITISRLALDEYTNKEIGGRLGVTKNRIGQIRQGIREKIESVMRRRDC